MNTNFWDNWTKNKSPVQFFKIRLWLHPFHTTATALGNISRIQLSNQSSYSSDSTVKLAVHGKCAKTLTSLYVCGQDILRTDEILSYIKWLRRLEIPENIDTVSVQWYVRRSSHCDYLKNLAPDDSFLEVLEIAGRWNTLKHLEIIFERDLPIETTYIIYEPILSINHLNH